jgi:PadR family transcriptional regulator PadR
MKFERELLKGVAPVVVLEILSRGKMYGYELSEALEQRSEGILTLGRGTLYPLLYNLEAKGLVAAEWEDSESKRKRRYYSITSTGKGELAAKKEVDVAAGGCESCLRSRRIGDGVGEVYSLRRCTHKLRLKVPPVAIRPLARLGSCCG